MILELSVENIAIIERSQIALGPGFTALTGETGAGKSLLVDAIGLALGGRADSELVRAGEARGVVSLTADLTGNPEATALCENLGAQLEDGQLYIHREVSSEGRSTCRIAGRQVAVSVLKQIGDLLVDLHGQHDHQSLLNADTHVEYLDSWIGRPAFEAREKVVDQHRLVEELRRQLSSIKSSQRDREHKLDLLRFQVNEIESVGPRVGELKELAAQLSRLQNAEKLAQASLGSLETLSNCEGSALEAISQSIKELQHASVLDCSLEPIANQIQSAFYVLEEATQQLRHYSENIESSPDLLEQVASRIDILGRLCKKYGDDEEAVLSFLQNAKEELELLENAEASADEVEIKLCEALSQMHDLAAELTKIRSAGAKQFCSLVQSELRELAMEKATFEVRLSPVEPGPNGGDLVEYFFSANAGEPVKPLSKIASGGEISRVMLAIKVALAGRAGVPTLIFDEVDTGLGGRAAAVVARKLRQLAEHYQVITISHLPQIAGRANTHFRIEKSEQQGRSVTQVRMLSEEERVHEIARMLAGEEIGESAMANARELLAVRS